ncbi:hypothetical protein V8C37DRAFT_374494 [Trichoderma ceciliae]
MMNSPTKEDKPAPAPTFKERLDEEATESQTHNNDAERNSVVKTAVDKISHVIPALAPIVGGSNPNAKVENEEEAVPPHRPEDDSLIEDFVREQHRSNNGGQILSSEKA